MGAGDAATMAQAVEFMADSACTVETADAFGRLVLRRTDGETCAIRRDLLSSLAREGFVEREGTRVRLTRPGRTVPVVNVSESPLAALSRRRGRTGNRFLEAHEFEAGERLRSDYEQALLRPRLGANWEASVAAGRRGQAGAAASLTDAAVAARQRVEAAIDAVGPELAGVLIDVCCFLKGLEIIEAERAWPVRSGKVVLKAALAALARHYRPEPKAARRTHRWGAEGYRPTI